VGVSLGELAAGEAGVVAVVAAVGDADAVSASFKGAIEYPLRKGIG
jgi:hypothetical protein